MSKQKQATTRELFHILGKTQRTRSAKANNVFRQLRNSMNQDNKALTTLKAAKNASSPAINQDPCLAMKNASRPSN